MSETIQIRHAILTDARQMSELVSTVTRQHIGPQLSGTGLQVLLRSMDEESVRTRLVDAWPTFCAFRDATLAGVIVIKPPFHLYQLFVRSDVHGKGIGGSLFEAAEKQVVEDTGGVIRTVNASLNAIQFYARLGFESQGSVMEHDGVSFQPMVRVSG
jgi:GNAT superfamily N-acetyltransferase